MNTLYYEINKHLKAKNNNGVVITFSDGTKKKYQVVSRSIPQDKIECIALKEHDADNETIIQLSQVIRVEMLTIRD